MLTISNTNRLHGLAIFLMALIAFAQMTTSVAQDGTGSHRRLQLPQNSPTEPYQQLARLFQYFQTLKGESVAKPPGQLPNGQSQQSQQSQQEQQEQANSGDSLSKLKQALGPQFSDLVDQIPPGAFNEAMKNPAVQGKVKQMLQQFSKDGKLPDFSAGNRESRDSTGSNGEKSQGNSLDAKRPDARQPDAPQPGASQPGDPRPDDPQPDAPQLGEAGPSAVGGRSGSSSFPEDNRAEPKGGSGKTNPTPHDRLDALMERFRQRRAGGRDTSRPAPPNIGQDIQSVTEGVGDRRSAGSGSRPVDADIEARLQELMQRQKDAASAVGQGGQSTGQQGRQQDFRSDRGQPSDSPTSPDSRSGFGRGPDSDPDANSRPSQAAPSMSDFLDQMQNSPAPDLKDLGIDMAGFGGSPGGRSGKSGMSGSLLADAMKQMDSEELRKQAKKVLQDKGLRNTLKGILKEAKQSAKEKVASGENNGMGGIIADVAAATGMEDTMMKALGGMTDELVEIAKDAKFGDQKKNGGKQSQDSDQSAAGDVSPTSDAVTDSKASQEKSVFQSFKESAASAMKSVSDPPAPSEADSGNSAAASTGISSSLLDSLSGSNLITFLFFGGLIAVLLASLFWGGRLLPANQVESPEQIMAALLKQGIRCKEDVIRAFHQFALKPPHEAQNWWTHSRVVDEVIEQYPMQSTRIQLLSALYEQARYLPDDTEFTDDQIRQAAEAVRIVGAA